MSPGVVRSRTALTLRRARSQYGDAHPATWAAYGRAIAAWGGATRIAGIAPTLPQGRLDLALVALNATTRAADRPGFANRHMRARRAA